MQKRQFISINGYKHILYEKEKIEEEKMIMESKSFYNLLNKRRSIRSFSDKGVPKEVITNLIKTASTAPSGAHKQPWVFCAVSNIELKARIRIAAEKEEKRSYESRMSEGWKKDLAPLGTDMHKPYLEIAPWLLIAFKKTFDLDANGVKHNNYYVNESVGIACGMLIAAIHNAGLATLTHTPSPMKFLADILNRPANETPFLLLPIGYPANPVYVPDIKRKTLTEVSAFYE